MKKFIVLALVLGLVWACHKADDIAENIFPGFVRPANFPEPVYKFERNPITSEVFELGRQLFYEPRLSRNNTIACGSCHILSAAFTHHGHDVSHGIDDRLGIRNPMPIFNMAWQKEFFWDGGVFDLDMSPVNAITNPVEMDESVSNVLSKLRKDFDYQQRFKKAFGSEGITDERFFKALSQFMLMAISANSKYDQVMRKENGVSFTDAEKKDYLFYQNNCSRCHTEPLFTDRDYHNNGLSPNHAHDIGRDTVTLNHNDRYKFKTPSLRNLSYTGPYMHDGRFLTLDRVLEHYRNGMVDSKTLDPGFRKADGTLGISMSDEEKANLLAFLKTLNDASFVNNKMLGEPGNTGFVVN